MCTIIKHKPDHQCNAFHLYISGYGLACGQCGEQCQCENEREYKKEYEKLVLEFDTLKNQYSFPDNQIKALKEKYNIHHDNTIII